MNKVVVISIIGLIVLGLILTFVLFSKSKKLPPPSPPPKPSTPPEVFAVGPDYRYTKDEAEGVCKSYGAEVATNEQLEAVQRAGAEWCFTGWLKDDNGNITEAKYPMQKAKEGCGDGPGIKPYTPPDGKAGVNCYGVKPPSTQKEILPFNEKQWNQPLPRLSRLCEKVQTECNVDADCKTVCEDTTVLTCQELTGRYTDEQKRDFGTGKYCLPSKPNKDCSEENGGVWTWTGWSSTDRMEWNCLCSYPNYFGNAGCTKSNPGICEGGKFNYNAKYGAPSKDNCTCPEGKIKMFKNKGETPYCVDENIKYLNYYSGSTPVYKKKSCEPTAEPVLCKEDEDCSLKCEGEKPGLTYTCNAGICKKRSCTPSEYNLKGCISCQDGDCVECLRGFELVDGNCIYNERDPYWTELAGVACRNARPDASNYYGCNYAGQGSSYPYKGPGGGDYYGCFVPVGQAFSKEYREALESQGILNVYGMPAYTDARSGLANVPKEFEPNGPLPQGISDGLKVACKATEVLFV